MFRQWIVRFRYLGADLTCLVLLVLGTYFLRAAELPLRGEEPTRAQVAFEMFESGDWIVPREQGVPFLIRPPLQNWLIAGSTLLFQSRDAWAIRFPSLVATLLTTLLIYGYGQTFLSRAGALTAAVVFATFGEMFQIGRQAETEALFILAVSGSLLLWHWGHVHSWQPFVTWSLGYGVMALGTMLKGPQAPLYFIGSVYAYLLLSRQWRRLFALSHLMGMLVGLAIVAAWAVPFAQRLGLPSALAAWSGDPAARWQDWKLLDVLKHLVVFPLLVLGGTLPWSPLLLLPIRHEVRKALTSRSDGVLFLVICLAVAFPTCWIHPGGQTRFFAPLFPCLALYIAALAECCGEADVGSTLHAWMRRFVTTAFAVQTALALSAVGAWLLRFSTPVWAQNFGQCAPLYAVGLLACAGTLWQSLRRVGLPSLRLAAVGIATGTAILFNGLIQDVRLVRTEHAERDVELLREQLPAGQRLVSLGGHTDSLFAYLWGLPHIPAQPWPKCADDVASVSNYFCFQWYGTDRPNLPFPWEEIRAVSMDRNHQEPPEHVVVIGHLAGSDRRVEALPAAKK